MSSTVISTNSVKTITSSLVAAKNKALFDNIIANFNDYKLNEVKEAIERGADVNKKDEVCDFIIYQQHICYL